jgi:DNA-binding NarL/FixJ family response regulator
MTGQEMQQAILGMIEEGINDVETIADELDTDEETVRCHVSDLIEDGKLAYNSTGGLEAV